MSDGWYDAHNKVLGIASDCGCASLGSTVITCSKHLQQQSNVIVPEGIKHDNGKSRMDLLPSVPLTKIADVLTFGANKYQAHNWRKGISYSRVFSALQRHLAAWNEGEDLDKESGKSHLAHAGCCLMFLLQYEETNKEFDDRYKESK